jgi:hypothetical protein
MLKLTPRLGVSLAVASAVVACTLHVQAQGLPEPPKHADDYNDPRLARGFQGLTRPTGIAEVGVGWLTLPGASVCAERSSGSGCKKGDTSFDLEAWEVYRTNRRFAFGAGLLLGLIPTTDAPRSDPQGIVRNHSRSYLTLEGTIRHYPYVGEGMELWWGVSGGLAVVSDRFEVDKNSDLALVGQRGVTIRTEGGSIGLVGGAVFWLAQHWSLGTVLRYGNWFLPKTAAKDPLLDEASLTGRNTMFSLGISLAYRIPL